MLSWFWVRLLPWTNSYRYSLLRVQTTLMHCHTISCETRRPRQVCEYTHTHIYTYTHTTRNIYKGVATWSWCTHTNINFAFVLFFRCYIACGLCLFESELEQKKGWGTHSDNNIFSKNSLLDRLRTLSLLERWPTNKPTYMDNKRENLIHILAVLPT